MEPDPKKVRIVEKLVESVIALDQRVKELERLTESLRTRMTAVEATQDNREDSK